MSVCLFEQDLNLHACNDFNQILYMCSLGPRAEAFGILSHRKLLYRNLINKNSNFIVITMK